MRKERKRRRNAPEKRIEQEIYWMEWIDWYQIPRIPYIFPTDSKGGGERREQ
jgi:hypothetical protein